MVARRPAPGDLVKGCRRPSWSPNGRYLAFTTEHHNPADPGRDGTGARRLSVDGFPAFWSRRTGNLYIVHGINSRYVFASPRGGQRSRLLFALPRHQSVESMDVK
jgi:Tol biopolymer transport system component